MNATNFPSLKAMAEGKVDGVQKTTQFQIDPRLIEIEQGFNARPLDIDHVGSMMKAIMNGATMPALDVRVDAGRVILVDGHHRHAAYMCLIGEGKDIRRVDCRQFRGSDVDRIAHLLTSAQGKPLTPLEMGLQYRKLISLNLLPVEIAAKVGKSRQHVDDMLILAMANSDVHGLVRSGKVSAKVAVSVQRKHGDNSGAVLAGHVAEAEKAGKKKATEKTMKKGEEKITDVEIVGAGKTALNKAGYADWAEDATLNIRIHLLVSAGIQLQKEKGKK